MAHGTVKFFNVAKGFGFITSDEDGKDVFVPAASIVSSGIAGIKAGQRVSFEAEPDKKGPKAVALKVIADVPAPKVEKQAPPLFSKDHGKARLTLYLDPSDEAGEDALAELRDAGYDPHVVDYIAAPPVGDELKRLSMLLRDSNQSLVRKYEPLFLELRLDDRFISDGEFWGAIHEHPSLINGPVVATPTKANICHSDGAVRSFLAMISSGEAPAVSKPKGLPERLLRLVRGDTLPASPAMAAIEEKTPEPQVEKAEVQIAIPPVKKVGAKSETKTGPKTEPKIKAVGAPPKAKPKGSAAVKSSAKKVAAKPTKKAGRAAKT